MSHSMRCWYSPGHCRRIALCRSYGRLSSISRDVARMFIKSETSPNHPRQCAMKLIEGMGGKPQVLYQGAHEPLGFSVG
jgi:hypothetical protein